MARKASHRTPVRILEASVIALAVFNILIWHDVLATDAPMPAVQSAVQESAAAPREAPALPERVGVPVRIRIPSLAVDASIEEVGLAADGSMDVPKRPLDTAWYALGPRPGETGSAAIAGHVDGKDGSAAVFADLRKVKPGDRITVQDDKGADILFVVRKIRRYDAEADALDVFSSNDGKAHLNIITCDGAWDRAAKQYKERLVVFTDKVAE